MCLYLRHLYAPIARIELEGLLRAAPSFDRFPAGCTSRGNRRPVPLSILHKNGVVNHGCFNFESNAVWRRTTFVQRRIDARWIVANGLALVRRMADGTDPVSGQMAGVQSVATKLQ